MGVVCQEASLRKRDADKHRFHRLRLAWLQTTAVFIRGGILWKMSSPSSIALGSEFLAASVFISSGARPMAMGMARAVCFENAGL
jgi:hypothetical protein